jgi:hypothetical protein
LKMAAAVSAVLTPNVDAPRPHPNAPTEAPNHTINIASDEPRPRTQSGNCIMNAENIVFNIAIVPIPQMSIATTATQTTEVFANTAVPHDHTAAANRTTISVDIALRTRGNTHTAATAPTPSAPDSKPKPLADTSKFSFATTGITDVSADVAPSTRVSRSATLRKFAAPTICLMPSPIA